MMKLIGLSSSYRLSPSCRREPLLPAIADARPAAPRRRPLWPHNRGACAPQYVTKTICVPEMVTESRTCTETVCVPQTSTRKVTCCQMVPVTRTIPCSYTVMVPEMAHADGDLLCGRADDATSDRKLPGAGADVSDSAEPVHRVRSSLDRAATAVHRNGALQRKPPGHLRCETHCVAVQETCTRCVDRGHWECRPAPCCCNCCGCCQTIRCWVPNCVTETVPVTVNKLETVQVPYTYQVQCCRPETRSCTVKVCHYESQVRTCSYQVCEYRCETRTRTFPVTECHLEQRTAPGALHGVRTEDRSPQPSRHRVRCPYGREGSALHDLGSADSAEDHSGPRLPHGPEDHSSPRLPALLCALLPTLLQAELPRLRWWLRLS